MIFNVLYYSHSKEKEVQGGDRMKRLLCAAVSALAIFIMYGCGSSINYELPDEPEKFNTQTFVSPTDKDDSYIVIEYNGKKYIPYGTLKGKLKGKDVGECLGYIVQDGTEDRNTRIYLLTANENSDYLAEINTEGFMEQPLFLRAEDTKGKNTDTPSYIENLGYDFWR